MGAIPTYNPKASVNPAPGDMLSSGLAEAGNRAIGQGNNFYAKAGRDLTTTGNGMVALAGDLDEHIKAYERHNTLSNMKTQIQTELADNATKVATDPNYKDHFTTWDQQAQDLKQTQLEQVGDDPLTRQAYGDLWNQYYPHYALAVKSNARKVEIKTFNGDLLVRQDGRESEAAATLGSIINQPGLSPQEVHDAAQAKIQDLVTTNGRDIAAAVKGGVVDYDDGVKMYTKFRDNLQYAYARSVAANQPGMALQLLSKGALQMNDPKQLQQISDAANAGLNRQITQADIAQRRQEAQAEKDLKITREQVNKDIADMSFRGKLTPDILNRYKDSRALDDSTYKGYMDKFSHDFQKRRDDYGQVLAKEFSLPPFESKVNPMDPNIAARTAANVQRHYFELVDKKGMDPSEASRQAANLGHRVNISAITMPEGLGLDESDRYKPERINGKLIEILGSVKTMTPEERATADRTLGPKIDILKNLLLANRFWASQATDRDQNFQEKVDELKKQEAAAERTRQQAAQQDQQRKVNPGGN